MDVREKLVDDVHSKLMGLLQRAPYIRCEDVHRQYAVNWLMNNGVTVQECGHWEDDHGDYVCSCCHTAFTDDLVWLVRGESNEPNYCPHCGVKMMPQPPKGE